MDDCAHLVFMGVSGCGKSTAAALAAGRLGRPLAEADDFHPAANIEKMAAGRPLDDADRAPWLAALRDRMAEVGAPGAVVTCSALKRAYRDTLREAPGRVFFVHLAGSRELIGARLAARTGHFMPADLLGSQYADLEPLAADEDGVTLDVAAAPGELVDAALAAAGLAGGGR